MDYFQGGSLYFHIKRSPGKRFTFSQAHFYSAQVMLGLQHLHSCHILYRDMKLENLLMDKDGHVHIADFGLSKEGVRDYTGAATTFCGTPEYVAPEMLKRKAYGKAADWWSFGILVYEMIVGRTPFLDVQRQNMFHGILHKEVRYPKGFPEHAQEFCNRLLMKDPMQRFGCVGVQSPEQSQSEFKTHPYLCDIDWDLMEKKQAVPPFQPTITNAMDTPCVPGAVKRMYPVLGRSGSKSGDVKDPAAVGYDHAKHIAGWQYPSSKQAP